MICKTRVKPFELSIKIEWRTWRQWMEPPNWSTNGRSIGEKGDPKLTKNTDTKKNCHPEIQSEELLFWTSVCKAYVQTIIIYFVS